MSREHDSSFSFEVSDDRQARNAVLSQDIDAVLLGRKSTGELASEMENEKRRLNEAFLNDLFQEIADLALAVETLRQWEKKGTTDWSPRQWQQADQLVKLLLTPRIDYKLALVLKVGQEKEKQQATAVQAFATEMRGRLAQKQTEWELQQIAQTQYQETEKLTNDFDFEGVLRAQLRLAQGENPHLSVKQVQTLAKERTLDLYRDYLLKQGFNEDFTTGALYGGQIQLDRLIPENVITVDFREKKVITPDQAKPATEKKQARRQWFKKNR
ncbi:MAG: hypothetical protein Q4G02_02735 [bacterium]|nr:hypothetical protein [bacterium]